MTYSFKILQRHISAKRLPYPFSTFIHGNIIVTGIIWWFPVNLRVKLTNTLLHRHTHTQTNKNTHKYTHKKFAYVNLRKVLKMLNTFTLIFQHLKFLRCLIHFEKLSSFSVNYFLTVQEVSILNISKNKL